MDSSEVIREPFCMRATGAAIHYRRGLVYFSTSRDQIHRTELVGTNGTSAPAATAPRTSIVYPVAQSATTGSSSAASGSGLGGGLAVDWLNDRVYFTEDNKVWGGRGVGGSELLVLLILV